MQMEIGEFFESVNDALKSVVKALGGNRKVGAQLRPELTQDDAAQWVRHCVDPERREKFSPEQVVLLLRMAREVGFHAAMDYIAADTGYRAEPVDLAAQVESLEQRIASGLEALNAQMAALSKMRERTCK